MNNNNTFLILVGSSFTVNQPVIDAIQRLGSAKQVPGLSNVWSVTTDKDAPAIRSALHSFMSSAEIGIVKVDTQGSLFTGQLTYLGQGLASAAA